ncbi:MFS general substrate transporter [Bimuria novae-zelandiae CBS 107.79]|uniref:MFS general substrate transporter n=1 Tax=Bimuria novae-zelandiae CBS 107.79 TaxID=1447943 RepID=A0A6A5VHT9_9PLEO|nr:MFS general substrate transporter [Bimuria novae-zelandiae CBS 107.79]
MSHQPVDEESQKERQNTLPFSSSRSQETVSVENISMTSSIEDILEPKWPRTWRAYACWLGCFFLMFNSWGLVNAYGTFSSYYVGNSLRDSDQLRLNLIGSTQCFLVLLFSAPIGKLLDAGHFRWVVLTGSILVPFGLFMLSVAHPTGDGQANFGSIWATQGLVVGLGMACFFVSSSQIASTWFRQHKSLAVGVVACGASVAGVIYPAMIRWLIEELGFNNAVRGVAGLAGATCAFSFFFAIPNPVHVHPKSQSYGKLSTWIDKDALGNKAFCWFTVAVAWLFLGFYPVFFNLEEWASVNGLGTRGGAKTLIRESEPTSAPMQTYYMLMIMNGASTVGRLAFAFVGDRLGALNMHIGSQIFCSLLVYILWTLAGSTAAAIAFCVFFGAFSGTVIGLPPASIGNILKCTYTDPSNEHLAHSMLGQWTGMMYSVAAVPALIGPLIAGHLVTEYSDYLTVQLWSAVSLTLSATCMVMARWHLPCEDGAHVSTHIWRFFGKHDKAEAAEKRRPSRATVDSTSRILSRSATRVNSEAVSRRVSQEKIDSEKLECPPEPAVLVPARNIRGDLAGSFPVSV